MNFRDFHAGDTLSPRDGVRIKTYKLNHPGGAIGYRIEWGGRAVALVFDIEHVPGTYDPVVTGIDERRRSGDLRLHLQRR